VLPDGHRLVTLQDAGTYITKLPKTEHEAPEWQTAMECLILVAEKNGPTMMVRIGVMRALIYPPPISASSSSAIWVPRCARRPCARPSPS
jgi:hypothetical protein